MDWIRRNWPDLLIGIALFSVITGIVATLLSGGTILPTSSSSDVNNDFNAQPSPSYLSSVATVDEPTNASFRNSDVTPVSTGNNNITVLQPNQKPINSDNSTRGTSLTSDNLVSSSVNSSDLTPVAEPRATPTNTIATAPDSTDLEVVNLANADSATKIYKISVGAFGNLDNARKLVAEVGNMGYKSGLDKSGNFSVVYVGPFSSRQQADVVAKQLKASNYEASIYSEDTSQPVATPIATTNQTTPVNQITATTNSTPSANISENSYLQVGAYRSGELSIPQSNQLASLGFKVMEYRENGFVKLMLGPYSSSEVVNIKTQLAAQGIDSFPRSIVLQ